MQIRIEDSRWSMIFGRHLVLPLKTLYYFPLYIQKIAWMFRLL